MRRLVKSACVVVAVWSCFGSAFAQNFISGKVAWDALSDSARVGYVMGVFDRGRLFEPGELSSPHNKYIADIGKCAGDMGLTSTQMVEIVVSEYSDLSNWATPPSAALITGLRKVCLAHMNRARTERGDELLKP